MYRPDIYEFNRQAVPTGNAEATITFAESLDSLGEIIGAESQNVFSPFVSERNRDPGRVPLWIMEVTPVNVLTVAGILYLIQETRFTSVAEQSILHEPRTFLWKYEAPILYLTETGLMDIRAAYTYQRIEIYDADNKLVDVNFVNVDEGKDEIFIDMVLGKFLQKIGRSRRAFTLEGQPVQYDATELVSEGIEIYAQAKERLYDQSAWYEAIK
jgi:hypothetical protein